MQKKIIVPEGMKKAFHDALFHTLEVDEDNALEAAFRWLSENPIVPTHDQIDEMQIACDLPAFAHHGFERICEEWQRRMFLAPIPEVLEAIRDLYENNGPNSPRWKAAILEAYRRGQESK